MDLKSKLIEATIDQINQDMIDNKQRQIDMIEIKLRDDKFLDDENRQHLEATIKSLQNQIKDLSGDGVDRELTDEDLENLLDDARLIVASVTSAEFVDDNDICQYITFGNISVNRMGETRYDKHFNYISSYIIISNFFKTYAKDEVFKVVLHEFIHSLNCCAHCGHKGKWLEIANAINSKYNNKYDVCTKSGLGDDVSDFYDYQKSNHKTVYRVECENCGFLMYKYSANAGVIKNPSNYTHKCADGKRGKITVIKEN